MSRIYDHLAQIIALLPASTGDIVEAIGVRPKTVGNWLREMCAAGIVARGEFRQREGRVYVRADGPAFQRSGWRYESEGLQRFILAWHALRARQTTDSLAALLECHRRTASEIVRAMRDQGLVTVAAWEMRAQRPTPVYDRLPRLASVPRPPRMPRQESNARYWAHRGSALAQMARAAA